MFHDLSINEIVLRVKSGDLAVQEIAQEVIVKTQQFQDKFMPWRSFDAEKLYDSAVNFESINRTQERVPVLNFIPVGVKDVFNTVDFPTEMGSPIWSGFTPGNDARVVSNLKKNGAVIAGKTVTAEFAVHALNETLNPHDTTRTPGTSSSGSAVAVSLGILPLSLGTQTGASIIRPASFCGVYGYKPSFGLIPRTGSLKTCDSLDSIGFFVAKPQDLRMVFDSIRVHGPNYPFSYKALKDESRQKKKPGVPWKIAFVKGHTWGFALPYAQNKLMSFINVLSKNTQDFCIQELVLPEVFSTAHEMHAIIYNKSLSYYFMNEFKSEQPMSKWLKSMIEDGDKISIGLFNNALDYQKVVLKELDDILCQYDVVLSLSTSSVAPKRGVEELPDPSLVWTMCHLPTLNVPLFEHEKKLPFGLQVFSRKYNDYLLLSFVDFMINRGFFPKRPCPVNQ